MHMERTSDYDKVMLDIKKAFYPERFDMLQGLLREWHLDKDKFALVAQSLELTEYELNVWYDYTYQVH